MENISVSKEPVFLREMDINRENGVIHEANERCILEVSKFA